MTHDEEVIQAAIDLLKRKGDTIMLPHVAGIKMLCDLADYTHDTIREWTRYQGARSESPE